MEFPEPQVSMLQNQHSPPHCCYLLHPGPWTVSSHWGSEHLYGGKQCRHPHFSGEELAQKGRDTCSRPHGWWVGVRPLNVCCQPCWGASSFLSWVAPPYTHTCLPLCDRLPCLQDFLPVFCLKLELGQTALEMLGGSHALLEWTSKAVPLRPDLSGRRGVCGCVSLQLWNAIHSLFFVCFTISFCTMLPGMPLNG